MADVYDVKHSVNEPHERLTRICDTLADDFRNHPEYEGSDKCIVLLNDGGERGGLVLTGYSSYEEALTNMVFHLKAVAKATGRRFEISFIDEDGVTSA